MRSRFAGLTMLIPDGWSDITDDLPSGTPHTLARPDGIGALQFSPARYRGGATPNIGAADLERLLEEFIKGQTQARQVIKHGMGRNTFVWCDVPSEVELIRVWFISDGRHVAMVSYVAQTVEGSQLTSELQDTGAILMSLDFQ